MKKYLLSAPVFFLTLFIIYRVQYNAYVYAFLLLLLYFAVLIYLEKREKRKLFFVYISSVLLALFIGECYFSARQDDFRREYDLVYGDELVRSDSVLGMVPVRNTQMVSRAFKNDSLIYEVTITLDRHGRRQLPQIESDSSAAAMFFGGSFTYGDGLEGYETLPYQFQKESNDRYQAYNFGFSGNGAHQTLAILENELERKGVRQHIDYVGVYSIITDHVLRGTYTGYNTNSPRYRFNEKGKIFSDGLFSKTGHRINNYLFKSNLIVALNPLIETPGQKDIDLVIAMLEHSSKIFRDRYQGEFYCLLWRTPYDEHDEVYEKILEGLTRKGVNHIEISEVLPDFNNQPFKYTIKHDGHPNALANKMIAEYLTDFLSKR